MESNTTLPAESGRAHAAASAAAPHATPGAGAAPAPVAAGGARDWTATLADLAGYRNDQVLFRFCRHFAIEREQAAGILAETMKWLWLCEYNRQANPAPVILRIDTPIRIIDEMWHNLILHTAEYTRLCARHFGAYVDHFPATEQDHADYARQRQASPRDEFVAARRQRARRQYELVYDQLGADTFRTWYVDFPRRYPTETIKALRR